MIGRGWMSVASIEERLEPWAASPREVKGKRSVKRASHHLVGGAMIGLWIGMERKCPLWN
jgi:hypothetical protein